MHAQHIIIYSILLAIICGELSSYDYYYQGNIIYHYHEQKEGSRREVKYVIMWLNQPSCRLVGGCQTQGPIQAMFQSCVLLHPKTEGEATGTFQLQTRDVQNIVTSLSPQAVLVKTQAAGVCHSDLHLWQGYFQIGRSKDERLDFTKRPNISYPIIPGHEIAGVVHTMGKEALEAGCFAVGDRVVAYPWIGCDDCPICATGEGRFCRKECWDLGFKLDGGYSQFVIVPHYQHLANLPMSVPFSVGALLPCSGLTAYSSLMKCLPTVKRMKRRGGSVHVAVVGLGGLGQWALQLLPYCLGRDVKVVGIDISAEKLKVVKSNGLVSDVVGLSRDETVEQQVESYDKSLLERPHAIIDFVNSSSSFSLCTLLLVRSGVHVMVGLHGGVGELRLPLAALSESIHVGNYVGSMDELKELIKMVDSNNIGYELITEYRLDEAEKALLDLEAGLINGRAVLNMR